MSIAKVINDYRRIKVFPLPVPTKPLYIIDPDDAWNYLVWYHMTQGHLEHIYPAEHPGFWEWWYNYVYANEKERIALQRELGPHKFQRSLELLRNLLDSAAETCDSPHLLVLFTSK